MTILELQKLVGGLSEPSKMPCHSYSTPARNCKTGGKLRKVKGSACEKCYALKGRYSFANVQNALTNRENLMANDPYWVENMAAVINRVEKSGFFRWYDSGSIQGIKDLVNIVLVCLKTPHIKHWLPTNEYGFVADYLKTFGPFPANLTVRLSAYMKDAPVPAAIAERLNVVTSSVSTKGNHNCPAPVQNNKCLDCRKCWDKNVAEVVYKYH